MADRLSIDAANVAAATLVQTLFAHNGTRLPPTTIPDLVAVHREMVRAILEEPKARSDDGPPID